MSPCLSLSLSCDHVQSPRQLSLVASVLLAQGDRKQVRNVGQRIFKVLESRQPEGPSPRPLLPVVSKVASLAPGTVHEDQANLLNKRLVDWLRYASVPQGLPHSSGGFFTPRARQPGPVTEVDGAVATDFFTVLSTAQRFTEDQWLNVQAFSMLRAWLQLSGPGGPGAPDTVSAHGGGRGGSPPRGSPLPLTVAWCLQCLVEAVLVLDVLCRQDPSFLYRTLSCLKALQARLCGDPTCVRVLLPLAQFFLSHGELGVGCPAHGRKCRLSPAVSERPLWDASLRTTSCPDTSQDPQLQGLLQHLLRAEASGAPERLAPLYLLLQPMAGFADGALTNQLARLLLERSDSLYQVPGYEARVHQ
ncbi:Protein KIAA0415 [Myotis davidii]|uniref:Protein KIAA0415 n=1 Tax=Myotis davidii TaxID=225400 RepID=L5LSJ4_MYODS|nr:Protein KIAA0415 [Myotis davidii]